KRKSRTKSKESSWKHALGKDHALALASIRTLLNLDEIDFWNIEKLIEQIGCHHEDTSCNPITRQRKLNKTSR
ncbi:UNVERIFIED_CONTAM: hypothetical protein Sindi_1309100, partial [Sesamum indicum]